MCVFYREVFLLCHIIHSECPLSEVLLFPYHERSVPPIEGVGGRKRSGGEENWGRRSHG